MKEYLYRIAAMIRIAFSWIIYWLGMYGECILGICILLAFWSIGITGFTHNEHSRISKRATWEMKENFVQHQGRYYIYREEIEGHPYYIYRYENPSGHLVDW